MRIIWLLRIRLFFNYAFAINKLQTNHMDQKLVRVLLLIKIVKPRVTSMNRALNNKIVKYLRKLLFLNVFMRIKEMKKH